MLQKTDSTCRLRTVKELVATCSGLTNSVAIWAQIQHFELVSPNTYFICELLDCKEEPVPQNQIQENIIATKDEDLKHGCDQRWRKSLSYRA